MTYSTQ